MFAANARFVAVGNHAPRRHRMTATGSFACPTTHGMVDGVFCDRAAQWPDAAMASPPGFAEDHIFVLGIPNLTDGGVAVFVDPANFARRQPNLRVPFIT